MEFIEFKDLVKQIHLGKRLPDAIYLHKTAIHHIPDKLIDLINNTANDFGVKEKEWNIIKIFKKDFKLTFLHYPDFDCYSYPQLHESHSIDLQKSTLRKASYKKSNNPPILHRKETFVANNYPGRYEFIDITKEGESIGLYESPKTIGFKSNWERQIKTKGYYLDETGRLKLKEDKPILKTININDRVERHKTAIDRNQLSQPMQALARHNYFSYEYTVLDYGCGKGDDVRELEAHGIDVIGWDPVHRKDTLIEMRNIVNLGFVINVIEDREERSETLENAWSYTNKVLVVSVMIAGDSKIEQFTPYKDGIITSINTFQKYYSQTEIRYYIESTLNENAIPIGQGIFFIFKDKLEEQRFLIERQHIKRDWVQKTQRQLINKPKAVRKTIIEKHIDLFTDYWNTTLELGRIPANDEFEFSEQIRHIVGSHNKAHHSLINYFGKNIFIEAQEKRKEDLLVYFALGLFEKRKPQTEIPESIKRDIKVFFKSITSALDTARTLLFSVGSPHVIDQACSKAYGNLKSGYLEQSHSYTFRIDQLGDIPAILRIYIGCATQLYGDIEDMHLIKAHIRSGKVSLMRYDNWNKSEPLLIERIKIKLRELDIDFFDYCDVYRPTQLLNKNIY